MSSLSSDAIEISMVPSRESEVLSSSVMFPPPNAVGAAPTSVISGDLSRRLDDIDEKSPPLSGSSGLSRPSIQPLSGPRHSQFSTLRGRPVLSRMATGAKTILNESYPANDPTAFPIQLPEAFTGAKGLHMPGYLKGNFNSVTLPSRLELLGNRSWKIVAAFQSMSLGNSILGFSPIWRSSLKKFQSQLFLLPWTFSKSSAKLALFVRFFILLICLLLALMATGAVKMNVGKVWPVGSACALYVIYRLAQFRRRPDGIMPFCRSIGLPECEEYMFSYSWKVEPENIRTLAKALWNTGVGVWIDVLRLVPGEAIRARLRTTIARVYRVVIFLSPEYVSSPNCCVEALEAVQQPDKLIICVLKPVDPTIMQFFQSLKGVKIVYGLKDLIRLLDREVTDPHNMKFFEWWQTQRISGSGVPDNVVPTARWTRIPRFSFLSRLITPERSLNVGALYLSGDCLSSGYRFVIPQLMLLAVAGVAINTADIITKYIDDSGKHEILDYVWLSLVAAFNLAPFFSFRNLLETRRDLSVPLKPLLASKSMGGGVKVRIIGDPLDPIVQNLRNFLHLIGHTPLDEVSLQERELMRLELEKDQAEAVEKGGDNARIDPSQSRERVVTVYVMNSLQARDQLFGSDELPFDRRFSLFVWSGPKDPFTKDEIGKRVMRFLVLVAAWEKAQLASSLFSAIGIRVVDALHAD